MGRAWRLIAASLPSVLGACSSSGSGAPAGADVFEWTEGGKTTVATSASYTVGDLFDGSTFLFTIRGIAPIGMTCTLLGQFAAAVPPPAGTYPSRSSTAPRPRPGRRPRSARSASRARSQTAATSSTPG